MDEFQSFATTGFSLILSEARKYGLTLTLAHQYLDQVPVHLLDAVFGNVGSMIAFQTGASDAERLVRQLDLGNPAALKELANFQAWATVLQCGMPSSAMRLDAYPPPEPFHSRSEKLKRHCRIRFGRDRSVIEGHIARFFEQTA